jgi:hypothetical protein
MFVRPFSRSGFLVSGTANLSNTSDSSVRKKGTLRSLIRQAGLSVEEVVSLLSKSLALLQRAALQIIRPNHHRLLLFKTALLDECGDALLDA